MDGGVEMQLKLMRSEAEERAIVWLYAKDHAPRLMALAEGNPGDVAASKSML